MQITISTSMSVPPSVLHFHVSRTTLISAATFKIHTTNKKIYFEGDKNEFLVLLSSLRTLMADQQWYNLKFHRLKDFKIKSCKVWFSDNKNQFRNNTRISS